MKNPHKMTRRQMISSTTALVSAGTLLESCTTTQTPAPPAITAAIDPLRKMMDDTAAPLDVKAIGQSLVLEPSPEFRLARDERRTVTPTAPAAPQTNKKIDKSDLGFATISDVARMIKAKEISPVEVVEACFKRMDAAKDLGAYVAPTPDRAMDAARRAEKEIMQKGPIGLLHGIPIGHKDNYDTADVPTTAGSAVFAGRIPKEDATAVAKLAAAGAITVGKLAMPALAFGSVGKNPWDTKRDPAGSSSGTGIAVAAGLCYGGTGTDTGGSIRLPASWNGCVGLKPTYGRVSRFGVIPHAFTLDHCGPLARTVADAAILLEAMSGYDSKDPSSAHEPVPNFRNAAYARDLHGVRVAIAPKYSFVRATPEVRETGEAAVNRLKNLGADVAEVELAHVDITIPALMVILACEFAAAFTESWKRLGPEPFSQITRTEIEFALSVSAPKLVAAQQARRLVQAAYAEGLSKADVLVTATSAMTATPSGETPYQLAGFPNWLENALFYTGPSNLTGLPALSLPVGFDKAGLPTAIQLIAKPFEEATLFRVASALEADLGLTDRHPKLGG